ncbi:MAG: cell division protein FtsL [Lachnospiraceae bacterium]|nr:cell division protein FtsL [Lachnospiraceae bacterium]
MTDYIIEGNTVRTLEREYRQPFKKPVSGTVQKNREKAAHMNVGYVAFLLLMAGVLFIGCTAYINLRNDITERQKSVERLQSKVAALKLQNDEEYDRIMGNVDMEEIKKIAMNELHMKYPDSGQVAVTESNDTDYVRQYRDIPSE